MASRYALRDWFRSRLGRHAYILWSPLTPENVSTRLSQNLIPNKLLSVGFVGSIAKENSVPPTWSVTISRKSAYRNSARFIFTGLIGAGDVGTWLTGSVGPSQFAPAFVVTWLIFVSLFLLAGLIGLITDLATGHGTAYLPLALLPLVLLVFCIGLIEFMSKLAKLEWKSADKWLRELLEGRDKP